VLKAARAYMVFDLLERSGEIVKSEQAVQDLEQEKFDRSFTIFTISTLTPEALTEQIMKISEIASATVTPLDADTLNSLTSAPAAAAEEAPAKPAELETSTQPGAAKEAAPKAASPAQTAPAAMNKTIRVDIERLDTLMNLFSELLI